MKHKMTLKKSDISAESHRHFSLLLSSNPIIIVSETSISMESHSEHTQK